MELRPYQTDLLERVRTSMREGKKSILLQAPTGSGKTALTAEMLRVASFKNHRSWFIVHRRELLEQSAKAFSENFHGIVSAGFATDARAPIQICSIQTLANRYHFLEVPTFIVWDECHHIAAGSWAKIRQALPDAYHVGLSATPQRLDGQGLGKYFEHMVTGPSVAWLIENGYLSKYKLFAPGGISVVGVHKRMGEFIQGELAQVVNKPSITGSAIVEYKRQLYDRRALGFAISIQHSQHVVEQFQRAGISAAHVDGDTDPNLRRDTLEEFREGRIKVIFNCQLFGEGVDIPAVEGLIDIAPSASITAVLQRWGRILRPAPGKEFAKILDHAQNCTRHGLPDDDRQWYLEGEGSRKKSETEIGVKICPKCFGAQRATNSNCCFCGLGFTKKSREVEILEGDLEEIDPAVLRARARQEQGHTEGLADLIALGKSRNYRNPYKWAKEIFQHRQRKKNRGVA